MELKLKHYEKIEATDVEMEGAENVKVRWLISEEDAPNFAMRMFEFEPKGHTPLHTHNYEHEIFILEGEGVLTYEKKEHEFKKGDFISIPPNKEHQITNTKDKLRLLCFIPLKQ